MRCDHHNAVTLGQVAVQTVTIIGSVADQPLEETIEEAVSEDAFDELALVRRSARDLLFRLKVRVAELPQQEAHLVGELEIVLAAG